MTFSDCTRGHDRPGTGPSTHSSIAEAVTDETYSYLDLCAHWVEDPLSSFRRYLEQERGLVPAAARGYVNKVRPFVARLDGPDGLQLWWVDVLEVRRFVVEVVGVAEAARARLGRRAAGVVRQIDRHRYEGSGDLDGAGAAGAASRGGRRTFAGGHRIARG